MISSQSDRKRKVQIWIEKVSILQFWVCNLFLSIVSNDSREERKRTIKLVLSHWLYQLYCHKKWFRLYFKLERKFLEQWNIFCFSYIFSTPFSRAANHSRTAQWEVRTHMLPVTLISYLGKTKNSNFTEIQSISISVVCKLQNANCNFAS